jgi:hypothetical protein
MPGGTMKTECTGVVTIELDEVDISRGFLEKVTFSQLLKKLPTFSGIRRFITTFTRYRHFSPPVSDHSNPHPTKRFL